MASRRSWVRIPSAPPTYSDSKILRGTTDFLPFLSVPLRARLPAKVLCFRLVDGLQPHRLANLSSLLLFSCAPINSISAHLRVYTFQVHWSFPRTLFPANFPVADRKASDHSSRTIGCQCLDDLGNLARPHTGPRSVTLPNQTQVRPGDQPLSWGTPSGWPPAASFVFAPVLG